MNPTAPNIQGLPKIHKADCPIRPIVNWKSAPAYKLAKHLNKLLQLHIPLPNAFNVKNPTHLLDDLYDIPYEQGTRLASFDTVNMYPSIPTNEVVPILENMSHNHQLDAENTNVLTKIVCTVLEQNYFTFQDVNYSQPIGLAMGAPSSAVLSEIYLQHLEHSRIADILIKYNVIGYFRYVDDILIIYNEKSTDINEIHKTLNNLAPTIRFTLEKKRTTKSNSWTLQSVI